MCNKDDCFGVVFVFRLRFLETYILWDLHISKLYLRFILVSIRFPVVFKMLFYTVCRVLLYSFSLKFVRLDLVCCEYECSLCLTLSKITAGHHIPNFYSLRLFLFYRYIVSTQRCSGTLYRLLQVKHWFVCPCEHMGSTCNTIDTTNQ